MIHPNASDTVTVRIVFVIGPGQEGEADHHLSAEHRPQRRRAPAGDRLASSSRPATRSSTPVDWKQGDDVIIIPAVSDEDAKEKFPKGWKALKPYLRVTPQPDK